MVPGKSERRTDHALGDHIVGMSKVVATPVWRARTASGVRQWPSKLSTLRLVTKGRYEPLPSRRLSVCGATRALAPQRSSPTRWVGARARVRPKGEAAGTPPPPLVRPARLAEPSSWLGRTCRLFGDGLQHGPSSLALPPHTPVAGRGAPTTCPELLPGRNTRERSSLFGAGAQLWGTTRPHRAGSVASVGRDGLRSLGVAPS